MENVKSQATAKVREGLKAYKGNKYGEVLKDYTAYTLIAFAEQNTEFAQAILDGGDFKACMDSVCKGIGSSISDLDVAKRAAEFYFPGSVIEMTMTIYTSTFEQEDAAGGTGDEGIVLNLEDFL